MKRLSFIVFLVCLMASGAYATNTWKAATGWWNVNQSPGGLAPGTACSNTIWSSAKVPDNTEQVKLATMSTVCTLDADAGTFTTNKVTVGQTGIGVTPTLNIVPGGSITINNELQVGDSSGKAGIVNQSGGTVTIGSAGKISVGYKSTGTTGRGDYTISGGTISSTGRLNVGYSTTGVPGSLGVFTVQGTLASITVGILEVGWETSGTETATGTLAFDVNSIGVSAIQASNNVYIDRQDNGAAIANLVVSLTTESAPPSTIVLVKNSSGYAENNPDQNSVVGVFDSVSGDYYGGKANEGDVVVLSTPLGTKYYYGMSYTYNAEAGTFGNGNDIALVPEPATIALFGLGLLALVRRPHRK